MRPPAESADFPGDRSKDAREPHNIAPQSRLGVRGRARPGSRRRGLARGCFARIACTGAGARDPRPRERRRGEHGAAQGVCESRRHVHRGALFSTDPGAPRGQLGAGGYGSRAAGRRLHRAGRHRRLAGAVGRRHARRAGAVLGARRVGRARVAGAAAEAGAQGRHRDLPQRPPWGRPAGARHADRLRAAARDQAARGRRPRQADHVRAAHRWRR